MGAMKEHLLNCQQLLKAGEYERLLMELKPWKDEAPGELWAVIAWLIVMEKGGDYIHYETEMNCLDCGLVVSEDLDGYHLVDGQPVCSSCIEPDRAGN